MGDFALPDGIVVGQQNILGGCASPPASTGGLCAVVCGEVGSHTRFSWPGILLVTEH